MTDAGSRVFKRGHKSGPIARARYYEVTGQYSNNRTRDAPIGRHSLFRSPLPPGVRLSTHTTGWIGEKICTYRVPNDRYVTLYFIIYRTIIVTLCYLNNQITLAEHWENRIILISPLSHVNHITRWIKSFPPPPFVQTIHT
jgi:hypothetical protein